MKKFIKNNFSNKNNGESKNSDVNENLEFHDFADYSAIGIFKLNTDTFIEYANQALAQILEYRSRSDLIGISFKDELISESADWEKIKTKLNKYRIAKNFIIPLKQNSGASIFVRIDLRAVSDYAGNTVFIEGSVTDISEFVTIENRIKKELQLLKEERESLSQIIPNNSEISNSALSKMIHKIKTPINSIVGFLTLIEQGHFNSEEEFKDFSCKARLSAMSLSGIIDGITEQLNPNATGNSGEANKVKVVENGNTSNEIITQPSDDTEIVVNSALIASAQESTKKLNSKTKNDPTPNSRKKILLVEDNPISQNVEMRLLKESGYSVVAVSNGEDAIKAVKTNEFSLVLMDVEMPNMDGLMATEIIRNLDSPINHVPIIAVTAHSSMKDREMCLASGMNDYIAKPININFMKMTIDQWLKKKIEI